MTLVDIANPSVTETEIKPNATIPDARLTSHQREELGSIAVLR